MRCLKCASVTTSCVLQRRCILRPRTSCWTHPASFNFCVKGAPSLLSAAFINQSRAQDLAVTLRQRPPRRHHGHARAFRDEGRQVSSRGDQCVDVRHGGHRLGLRGVRHHLRLPHVPHPRRAWRPPRLRLRLRLRFPTSSGHQALLQRLMTPTLPRPRALAAPRAAVPGGGRPQPSREGEQRGGGGRRAGGGG
ncbi:uncharacterized protein [Penaeus vannamei]|uniref:uncharacterized protein isoform X1 n=1 Tax=Penaeus vannamei TaxID=6689 RepID=UPI00387F4B24